MLVLQEKSACSEVCRTVRQSRPPDGTGKIPLPPILSAEGIEHVLLGTVPHGIPTHSKPRRDSPDMDQPQPCRSHATVPSPYPTIWPIQTAPYLAVPPLAAAHIACNCIYDDRPRNRATLRIDMPVSMTFPHVAATILTIPLSSPTKRTCPWCNSEGFYSLHFSPHWIGWVKGEAARVRAGGCGA